MSVQLYLGFVAATAFLIMLPGPNVTIIIANSAAHGMRAGLLSVAGTEAGAAILLIGLMLGLAPVMELASAWFDWLRLAGAAYLIWLGLNRLRRAGRVADDTAMPVSADRHFFWQGLTVMLSNPKVLLFFAAFLPQFIDPKGHVALQLGFLALSFLVIATVIDGLYAMVAGHAGRWLTGRWRRPIDRFSGLMLIGGGVWLALARR